jgi:hypothetical protein
MSDGIYSINTYDNFLGDFNAKEGRKHFLKATLSLARF